MKEERQELNKWLSRLPDVPVASNFTARVLQAAEIEGLREGAKGASGWRWIWRSSVPRIAVVTASVVLAGLVFHQQELQSHRTALAKNVALFAATRPLPSVEALKNFDAIQRMSRSQSADEELIALLK